MTTEHGSGVRKDGPLRAAAQAKRVLIALDDTNESVQAAQAAVRLFTRDAEYLVLNVGHRAGIAPYGGAPMAPYGLVVPMSAGWWIGSAGVDELGDGVQEATLPDEDEVEERARRLGVPDPQAMTEIGDPVDAICAAADEHDVDVIVVGAHDKGFLRRMVDPSVSAGVVRSTSRPVLVVSMGSDSG